jgi:membrane protein
MVDDTSQSAPRSPTDLSRRSWWDVVKRSVREYQDDNLGDWAAALTYYGVLSIFPALLAAVSILGLFGSDAIEPLLENVGTLAPGPVKDILERALTGLEQSQSSAGLFTVIGIVLAVWSASGYVGAFMRASNAVYDIREGRPIWKTLPTRVAVTIVILILLVVSAVIVFFTGRIAERAGDILNIGDAGLLVWNIAKWPVLLAVVVALLGLLYWAAPNVRARGFRWISPGSLLAVVLWIIASVAFAFYVANFGSYNKVYGTLAGTIIFLIWLWVTNIAVLFGLEFDAELWRERAIEAGHPPAKEPYAEPRDTRKLH